MSPIAATVESAIDRFEQRWRAGEPPVIEEFLREFQPQADQRKSLLVELIAVEMEYRWRMSRPGTATSDSTLAASTTSDIENPEAVSGPMIDEYFSRWPEIATDTSTRLELIAEEYRIRHRWGDHPSPDEYVGRFGDQLELPSLLARQYASLQKEQPTRPVGSGAPGESEPYFSAGERFGRYHILRRLGQGGMGEVYLAEDTQLHRRVALKLPFLRQQQQVRERFLNEARATAALHHPGICSTFDAGNIDGQPFLTMAYIDGNSLRDDWNASPPDCVDQVILLVAEIARAMDAAHQEGVVHRDLKPSNIMLTAGGHPVVTDFGLAARESGSQDNRLTTSNVAFGSPAYMSPEQVEGRSSEIGPSSDIYSLGVILYEGLTGRLPFDGTTASVMHKIVHERPTRPSQLRPEVDDQLNQLCLDMLAKAPGSRPQSMAIVADRLDAMRRRLQSVESSPRRSRQLNNRSGLVAIVAIAMLITIVALFRLSGTSPTEFPESTSARENPNGKAASTSTLPSTSGTSPGHALAFDGRDDMLLTPIRYDGRGPFTIEAWIAPADPYGNGTVISNDDGGGLSLRQHYAERSRARTWSLTLGPPARPLREATVASRFAHRAHHVAVVWDGEAMSLFVDGQLHLSGSKNLDNMPLMDTAFVVGTRPRAINNPSSSGVWFHGEIDELRFSRTARYRHDFRPNRRLLADASTDALYHFDEGTGAIARDASGAGNHGEIVGARWISSSELDRPGEYARRLQSFFSAVDRPMPDRKTPALRFSNRSAHVTVSPLGPVLQAPFTMEAWIEPDSDYVSEDWKRVAAQIGPFSITIQNDHDAFAFQAWFGNRRGVDISTHSPDTALYGRRTHLAAQCTGNELQLFLNGQRSPAMTTLRNLDPDDAQRRLHDAIATLGNEVLTLGRRENGNSSWGGSIDRFRISRGLRYTDNFTPEEFTADSETILMFDFHEGAGAVLHDVSGHGHHGAIHEAEWIRSGP